MAERVPSRERVAAPRSRRELWQTPVPGGRDSEREWPALLEAAWEDVGAGDVVAELVARVMDACAQAFAQRERVPFSVCWARDAILLGARWRFPVRDEGDTDPGADREDREPLPCPLDTWMLGSVPIQHCRSQVSVASVAKPEAPTVPAPQRSQVPPASTVPVPEPPDEAVATRPPKVTTRRSRPLAPRTAPQRPAEMPVSRRGDPLVRPQRGRQPPRPLQRDMARVESHEPPTPPSGPAELRPREPPRSTRGNHESAGTALALPPLRRPLRWIRPQVEVLDVGAGAKGPARGRSARGRSRGIPSTGDTRTQPIPLPPVPLLGLALAHGVTVRWGGSQDGGACAAVPGEKDEDAERDLRPIRPGVTFPDIVAARLSGDGGC